MAPTEKTILAYYAYTPFDVETHQAAFAKRMKEAGAVRRAAEDLKTAWTLDGAVVLYSKESIKSSNFQIRADIKLFGKEERLEKIQNRELHLWLPPISHRIHEQPIEGIGVFADYYQQFEKQMQELGAYPISRSSFDEVVWLLQGVAVKYELPRLGSTVYIDLIGEKEDVLKLEPTLKPLLKPSSF